MRRKGSAHTLCDQCLLQFAQRPRAHRPGAIKADSTLNGGTQQIQKSFQRCTASSPRQSFFFAIIAAGSCQLTCNSQLRFLPQFEHLFAHCQQCSYSRWSEWAAIRTTAVPTSQCPSGRVLTEERRRVALSSNCDDEIETRDVCK